MPQTASIDPVVAHNLKAIMLKRGRSAYSVAKALGVSPNWIYRVLNMDRGIMLPRLREIADELGVSLGELVDPPSENGVESNFINEDAADDDSKTQNIAAQFHPIQVLEVGSAAGSGAEIYDETPIGVLWFRDDWLREHRIDPARCNVIGVSGDSMEPTLPDGCSILVDRSRRELHDKRIYVMRNENGLVVKRVLHNPQHGWLLISDNITWPTVVMSEETDIVGEVRWSGRTF